MSYSAADEHAGRHPLKSSGLLGADLDIFRFEHVGRLSVIHVPYAVIQTKHGRSTLGLLTAGNLCLARPGYASSFRSGCATRRLSSLAPASSS